MKLVRKLTSVLPFFLLVYTNVTAQNSKIKLTLISKFIITNATQRLPEQKSVDITDKVKNIGRYIAFFESSTHELYFGIIDNNENKKEIKSLGTDFPSESILSSNFYLRPNIDTTRKVKFEMINFLWEYEYEKYKIEVTYLKIFQNNQEPQYGFTVTKKSDITFKAIDQISYSGYFEKPIDFIKYRYEPKYRIVVDHNGNTSVQKNNN